jgi:hypothetical protein
MPIKLSVLTPEITPPNKNFLIGGLLFAVIALIIFIGVIYHYENLERRLSSIYKSIKLT